MSYNLQNLQSLRLIAALLVLVQHTVYFSGLATNDQASGFLRLLLGDIGVFIFFVISGFVIAMQTDRKPLQFMMHRVFRIYPGYIAALILSTVIFVVFSNYLPTLSDTPLSIFLIPTGALNISFQVPYWTLIYEMFFYALVLVVMTIFRGRQMLIDLAIFAWLLVIIYYTATGVSFNVAIPTSTQIIFSPLNIYFIAGFFLSRALLSESSRIAFFAIFIAAASSVFIAAMKHPISICALTFAAIALVVKSKPLPKALNKLGDYSYGLYLIHLPIIYCVYLALQNKGVSLYASIALMALAALPAAVLFGKIEHWLYKHKVRPTVDRLINRKKGSADFSAQHSVR